MCLKTPRVGIFMWVWWLVVLERVSSLPLSSYFFHQWVIPTFLEIKKKKIGVLVCLLFYGLWPLEMIRVCHHQHQHSFLHLCSFVFSIPLQALSQKQRGKLEMATVWAWVTQAARSYIISDYTSFIKAKRILYLIEDLHDVYRPLGCEWNTV